MQPLSRSLRRVFAAALLAGGLTGRVAFAGTPEAPPFDSAFDAYWGDQKAELAAYDLTQPRYGELRAGTAVTITVTEPFSNSLRVKADDGKHPPTDVFPALKLNLVEDFQTGVYDYNLMTSVFLAMKSVNGRGPGEAVKVSFSAQEWCGHAYAQILPDASAVRFTSHSYFDGEADEARKLDQPRGGLSEDTLLLWARGLAAPYLKPGESVEAPVLRSLKSVRLLHRPPDWASAKLTRQAATTRVELPTAEGQPSQSIEAEVRTVAIEAPIGRTWTIYVEAAHPNRVLKWTTSDGETATLIKSTRLPYWQLHREGDEKQLADFGLSRRPARTP